MQISVLHYRYAALECLQDANQHLGELCMRAWLRLTEGPRAVCSRCVAAGPGAGSSTAMAGVRAEWAPFMGKQTGLQAIQREHL